MGSSPTGVGKAAPAFYMTIYPKAVQTPLADHSYPGKLADHSYPGKLADKKILILHITQGASARSAIDWFRQSARLNRLSAHFVIDRDDDATVFQLLPCEDQGFHASEMNGCSIGIEHAAIAGNPQYAITEAQYTSSAVLVAWLCETVGILCDRAHVKGYYEASKTGAHVGCCGPTLDLDRVVEMAKVVRTTRSEIDAIIYES